MTRTARTLLCVLVASVAFAALTAVCAATSLIDIEYWGYGDRLRSRVWVGPEGRMATQSLLEGQPSAWDIWPTRGAIATVDAVSEVTIHRRRWDDPCVERLSTAAMVDGDYRVSIERGSVCKGEVRAFRVCFDIPPEDGRGPDNCPLRVTPQGVFVSDDGGMTWRRL